ncbi:monovalent cation/H+ antiporter complex subunit F [Hydrogenophaga sp. R2]|uniref:monovalent cation/H+ antiporter complex subunit F n=1 Tax=Hydrogenophaga sp. R2 TaxID=3132827 RepID=UPI003CF37E7C
MSGWVVTALIVACLASLALATVRLLKGPTSADRIVALDIFLAASVALCVAASLATGRTVFLDVAIGLALVGFVGTVGWARLVDRSADLPEASDARNRAEDRS